MPTKDVMSRTGLERRRSLTLTLTEDCNLRCRYCYETTKSRDRYMSFSVAQQAISEYMEMDDGFDAVEIDFFGGEPMLAFGLIQDLVDWFHNREWRKRHVFFIGSNGTILTDGMKSWLIENKHCVYIGVSLDGNKVAHDLNRSNSYDLLMQNMPFFIEHWPDQPVKMTINAESIPFVADSIIELEEMRIPFTANLVFEDIWGTPERKSALLSTYAQQLDRLVEYYLAHSDLFPARLIDVKCEFLSKDWPGGRLVGADCVRWCGAGHEMVVIEVDGSRSPCHRFSSWVTGRPLPKHIVNRQTSWKPDKCNACKLALLCPTCAGFNWQVNGDSGTRTTYHCEAFKLEVQASAKLQALRLLQRTPSDLANLSPKKAHIAKFQLDTILDLATNGL